MKPLLLAMSLVFFAVIGETQEFRDLFNGKDLDGWVAEGDKEYKGADGNTVPIWSVRDGRLHCDGKGFGFLRYDKQEFADFVFHVEYRMTAKGNKNSGIGIRTRAFDKRKSRETRPSFYSYEIQLLDDAGKPPNAHSTGSLYRYIAPKSNPVKPAGDWNVMDIECVGPRIRISLNGESIIDTDQSTNPQLKNKPQKGYVCLQNHGGEIEFRNVRIREITASEAKP